MGLWDSDVVEMVVSETGDYCSRGPVVLARTVEMGLSVTDSEADSARVVEIGAATATAFDRASSR